MKNSRQPVSGLVKLYAELAGRTVSNKMQAAKIAEDMGKIAAVIHMFSPDYDVSSVLPQRRYKRNTLFKRGTLFQAALQVLRSAAEPLSINEIARLMLKEKGIQNPSTGDIRVVFCGVHASLKRYSGTSIIQHDDAGSLRWSLKAFDGNNNDSNS